MAEDAKGTRLLIWALAGSPSCISLPCAAQSVEELRDMPIEALANLDVSSVTKSAARLSDATASIYVITPADIVRAGTVTLSGILRLAPHLQVLRSSASRPPATARGPSGPPNTTN